MTIEVNKVDQITLKKLILEKITSTKQRETKISRIYCSTQNYNKKAMPCSNIKQFPLYFVKYLSRGLCLPRVKSILTLLTATSSSFSSTPPFFCHKKIAYIVEAVLGTHKKGKFDMPNPANTHTHTQKMGKRRSSSKHTPILYGNVCAMTSILKA